MKVQDHKEEYKQLLGFVLGMGLLGWLFGRDWLWQGGITVGLLGLFWAGFRRIFVQYWLWLGATLGMINSKIILSLIFFIVLVPTAWLSRLFSKKDPLQLHPPKDSNFVDRGKAYSKEDLEKMW